MPYYKSDFSIVLELADRSGNDIGVPPFDWRASFTTGKYPHYVASSIGGKLRNCVIEDGRIRVLFDRHGLGPGTLKCEFVCLLPDGRYPDSTNDVVKLQSLDVVLTASPCDCPCDISAKIELPAYIRDFDRLESTYGMALDEIVSRLETVLGREPSGDASAGTTPVGLPKISLEADVKRLKVLGYEPYVDAGYKPMIFRYCKWSNKSTDRYYGPRRKSNSLHAFFGGYQEWRIDEDGCIYELLDAHVDERAYTPREWLSRIIRNRIDGGVVQPELFITHGRNCSFPFRPGPILEYAFAFVKEKQYAEAYREPHCVSNIVSFQVVLVGDVDSVDMVFSTARPHRRIRRRFIE
ncbi:hypothetical protein [uncultured Muribaculum sp.]|jgi:hypothetical protein|uniref:hypothetical protein n=1 Tax=uncultured Muribaculum sp. TaxID=1918613 RepID=UPI0025B13A7D|nr:hypothetical protein [uncultured Muribaculum sp.]